MTTLVEFLLARIAEDEADVRNRKTYAVGHSERCIFEGGYEGSGSCDCGAVARVLADCEAKRRIVERFAWAAENPDLYRNDMELMDQWQAAWDTLADAAAIHADHPDYDESWRP